MYHILIVDDEEKIRELIKIYAEFEGHTVTETSNGMEAVNLCKNNSFDIIVLDIMMPVLDGLSAAKQIRTSSDTPIILLSARGEEYDKIGGFQAGVDDYVVKPFSPKELMLRIDAIMKRSAYGKKATESAHDIMELEGLTIDFTARIVYVDGESVTMSPKEYELLFYMAKNINIALSRAQLISNVWGYDFYGDDRTLDTHIKLLRKSLGKYSKYITTLRGVGYRFEKCK